MQNADRLARALLSLDGLSVGDAFGGMFFHSEAVAHGEARLLPPPPMGHLQRFAAVFV